jgi:hypothetical protein
MFENVLGILFGIGLVAVSLRIAYSYFIALNRDRQRIEAELEREEMHRRHWQEWQISPAKTTLGDHDHTDLLS